MKKTVKILSLIGLIVLALFLFNYATQKIKESIISRDTVTSYQQPKQLKNELPDSLSSNSFLIV